MQLVLDQEELDRGYNRGDFNRDIEVLMADQDVQLKVKRLEIRYL